MGRGDNGLATPTNWAGRRSEVLEQAQNGICNTLGGNQVYIDLVVGDRSEQPMRLVFMLFEQTPLALANFHALCTSSHTGLGEGGHPLRLRTSKLYSIAKGRSFEGGDITLGDGRGGDSIYGSGGFEDEAFGLNLRHDAAGLLSMVSEGNGANQSRFRVSFGPMPELDGRAVIIGRLVSGAMHLPTIEGLPVDATSRPVRPITLVECGAIPGFASLPPPLPVAPPPAAATLDNVGAQATDLRNAVADAVSAAMSVSTSGAVGGGGGGGGGGGSGAKRSAPDATASASKRGPMMALPFEDEIEDDDDDDDNDDDNDDE